MKLDLDIETRSRIDLKKSNVYRYVECPDFKILMVGWSLDDSPVRVAFTPEEILGIPGLWDPEVTKVAHNAAFERICFSEFAKRMWVGTSVPDLDPHEYLDPREWVCTQALAGEHGYPQKLEDLAVALGGEKKDSAGTRLINLFSKPNRKGEFNDETTHPEEWLEFVQYCVQDVVVLKEARQKMPDWPNDKERQAYVTDQHINDTGIQVDVEMAKVAIATADANKDVQVAEIQEIAGIDNPNSGQQMLNWLNGQGVDVDNLQAATVTALLEGELEPEVRRVLELRQELALVAMKKYQAALDRVNPDGRLRGSFQFFGAHTGRWSGRGVQLQNLPSATIQPREGEDVDTAIAAEVLDLHLGTGTNAHTLKALVRAMFTGPFTVVDYSAIEARVVAWLAGEQWALDAFAAGRDIYVETATRMGKQYTRKDGKIATLALGYNGGVNSMRAMGAEGDDQKLQRVVYQWRDSNENICGLWQELDRAFRTGDAWAGEKLYVARDGQDRQIILPSGRAITYHGVKEEWKMDKWGRRVKQISFRDPNRHPWRADTYGGRLTENVTQAVARDVLSEALVRLHGHGHTIVGHVHDEILVEGLQDVSEISKIMVEPPTWSAGLPLAAEGFNCPRYRKD